MLTNDTYSRSVSYLKSNPSASGTGSLDRFARAATQLRAGAASLDRAFEILASVAQPGSTRWSVVYDARRKEISWISDRNRRRKTVRMESLSLDCGSDAKMLDVHSTLGGDVTSYLEPYDAQRNRDLVLTSYATTSFTRNEPQAYAIQDAAHADSVTCAGPRRRAIRK